MARKKPNELYDGIAIMGTYAIIRKLSVGEVLAGRYTSVIVQVDNEYLLPVTITVTGNVEGTPLTFKDGAVLIESGGTYGWVAFYTVPEDRAIVSVWSYWWTGTKWVYDDYAETKYPLYRFRVWDNAAKEWKVTPISLPLGVLTSVSAMARNWSDVSLNLMLEFEYISPTGISTKTTKTVQETIFVDLGPTSGVSLTSPEVYLREIGVWTCHLRLYDSPQKLHLLDEWQVVIAEVAELVPNISNFTIADYMKA